MKKTLYPRLTRLRKEFLIVLLGLFLSSNYSFADGAIGIKLHFNQNDRILNGIGIRYKFRVHENLNQSNLKIIFTTRRTYTPNQPRTYLMEANLYSRWVEYQDTSCLGWPPQGEYHANRESGLWVSVPDYNLLGQIGVRPLNPITKEMFPRQNSGIDNISALTKIETISQMDITNKDISIEYLRGDTFTSPLEGWGHRFMKDKNEDIICVANLPADILYRMWNVNIVIDGKKYKQQIALPEDGGRFLYPDELMSIVTEFFNHSGFFQAFFWDFEILRENSSEWKAVKKWKMTYRSDQDENTTYGAKRTIHNNKYAVEISNDGTDSYIKKDEFINLNFIPVADAGEDFSLFEGETGVLNGTGSFDRDRDNISYSWFAPYGIQLSDKNSQNPSFVAPEVEQDSALTFKLRVNDGFDVSEISEIRVSILNKNNTAMDKTKSNLIHVYPNPSSGMIYLEGESTIFPCAISVYDMTGNRVYHSIENKNSTIDLSRQRPGIYILSLMSGSDNIVKKLMIE